MGLFFFLFITLIIILFIPFPVKIKVKYSKKNFTFKIYNLNISNKIKSMNTLNCPETENKLFHAIKTLKNNLNFIKEIKFKLNLKINMKITYGLEDAAHTALAYGFIHSINTLALNILSKIFIIKQKQIYINPDFNNLHLKIQINSIIYISLAKIIYTGILLMKYRRKLKKLNPIHT